VSLLTGAYLVHRSLADAALNGLRRQVALLARENLHPSPGPLGRFLATQDERLSVLPRRQAELLLPDDPAGHVTVNGREYLYATRASGTDVVVLLRTASSVRADNRPFWLALAAAGVLGCALAAGIAALLARGIARPVVRVARASGRLAAGASPEPLPIAGSRELRELADSFNTMADQLMRAREAERSFLLSVSHELRTPLTAIRGYAEALDEGVLAPDSAVDVIRTEATRLERLIADILQLARLDRQRFDVHPTTVDLAEIARESASRLAPRAQELGIELSLEQMSAAPATADADRLLQAVSNLVENALRCTPRGGKVTLATAAGAVSVKDTGPGIAPDEVPRAFERFFLYRRYSRQRPVGTGLGLAIVRDLARAMGGDVEVESPPGSGATFTIRLPVPGSNGRP
jgi:two-component system, OmpR family, sensor kinase